MTAPSHSIKLFNRLNYNIQSAHIKNILYKYQLLKYIDQREDITDYNKHENQQALLEIEFTLANNQIKNILTCTTAYDAWEKL